MPTDAKKISKEKADLNKKVKTMFYQIVYKLRVRFPFTPS
jgi:hypothetical protein